MEAQDADCHILVIDDDHELREILCDALRLEGYQVVCVEHGLAGLKHLRRGRTPCLILLDLMMPVMDGPTFRQALLSNRAWAEIPVVVVTAGGRQLAASISANQVLEKPLAIDAIVDLVKEHCPELVHKPGRRRRTRERTADD